MYGIVYYLVVCSLFVCLYISKSICGRTMDSQHSLHSKPYYQNTRASSAPAHLLVLLRTNQSSAIALFLSALFSLFLHLSHRARLATVLLNVYKEITSALSGTLIRAAWKYIGESCHPAVNHRKATTMLYDHFYFVLKHLYWTGRNPQQADLEKFNTVPSVGWGEINMRKAPTEVTFPHGCGCWGCVPECGVLTEHNHSLLLSIQHS